jgi:periplasmic protein TonB
VSSEELASAKARGFHYPRMDLATVGGAFVVDRIRLPLALSITGHAVVLALLILFPADIRPSPQAAVPGGIEVVFSQSVQQTRAAPAPETSTQPAPANVAPPTPDVPDVPPDQTATLSAPPPPHKPVVREPPKHVVRRPERPRAPISEPIPAPAKFAEMRPAGITGAQNSAAETAASVAVPAPVPRPDVTVSYQAMISAWLESHKRYPESARERGEEGSAALRFRIDRSGRVLDYSYASTGYADLDAGLDEMMRGAQLPPFPPGMTASRIEVSLTMRFNLTR